MIVVITGSSGFIGGALVDACRRQGWTVRELQRPVFRIGERVPEGWLADAGVLIHCAYDFTDHDLNVRGTHLLLEQALAAGIRTAVVISSMSAGAPSAYGQAKQAIERLALVASSSGQSPGRLFTRMLIIRPGLVTDDAGAQGILGQFLRMARWLPVIPLIDGGRQLQYLCHIDDLAAAVVQLLVSSSASRSSSIYTAATEHALTFREIILRYVKKPTISIPYRLLLFSLSLLERLHLSGGLRSDSLIGLVHQPQPDFRATRRAGLRFRNP